ncbi:MAG: TetR family transcriptional regulator C-terminal domain-containing protein [Albidovulum sp.]|uniref:TetR/AcrR family transcriptional regulator n=1 Tax=Albidovulum sp. TaxID=1872424 RepID=UPI003CB8EDD9
MIDTIPKFRREPAEQRRESLIQATLSLIAEKGIGGATVRAIASRAEVTQGLIRHHFSSKDDLVLAAYEYHMRRMTDIASAGAGRDGSTARSRLAIFVSATLTPPVLDPGAVMLWAGFLNKVPGDARMREIHERTYHGFRNQLEAQIAAVLHEAGRDVDADELRRLAIASNAVLDGLWLEGGALPDAFSAEELLAIGLKSVSAIIGVDLAVAEEQR